jgi:hypothetical protein
MSFDSKEFGNEPHVPCSHSMTSTNGRLLMLVKMLGALAVGLTVLNTVLLYKANIRPHVTEAQQTEAKVRGLRTVVRPLVEHRPILDHQRSEPLVTAESVGVLVIACQRASMLRRSLTSILKYLPSVDSGRMFPVIVSQDGDDPHVKRLLEGEFKDRVYTMRHEQDPSPSGYARLSKHYRWALSRMFHEFRFRQVIVLEEDIEISSDFFSYFTATLPLLRDPKSKLYCVSAWNDNGRRELVEDSTAVYRTDFFPGLGWMLTDELFAEVEPSWPDAYWDEYMRRPDVRKGRHCLRPEINRL